MLFLRTGRARSARIGSRAVSLASNDVEAFARRDWPLLIAEDGQSLEVQDKWHPRGPVTVQAATREHVKYAIAEAVELEEVAMSVAPEIRSRVLAGVAEELENRSEEFAAALCFETGKTISEARVEVSRAISVFKEASEVALEFGSNIDAKAEEFLRGDGKVSKLRKFGDLYGMHTRVPKGACLFITPFNFPLNLVAHKVAPALACGAPFVLKPAEATPLSALLLNDVLLSECKKHEHPVTFSVLPTRRETAVWLGSSPDVLSHVKLVSFTGGNAGASIRKASAQLPLARSPDVVLELGGVGTVVVDSTVPKEQLPAVAKRVVAGAMAQAGQSCISVQRVLVSHRHADELRRLVTQEAKLYVPSDPYSENTRMGGMISKEAATRAAAMVEQAVQQGAKLLCGGTVLESNEVALKATVLADVSEESDLFSQEVFAPVCFLNTFHDSQVDFVRCLRALSLEDSGLQAALFTCDLARVKAAHKLLKFGGVVVNDICSRRVDALPYGGERASGRGREGVRWAMHEMTTDRVVLISDNGMLE
ncbi:MAG: hypothetical protein MHM6MM_004212 [Cercozoa sp. M6MM]